MAQFITRFGAILFLSYMLGGGALMVAIDSVFNGGFNFSVKVLWLPVAFVIFGFTWSHRDRFYRVSPGKIKAWALAVLLYPLALLMSWPYLMLVNAVLGRGSVITFHGPVQDKFATRGRYGTTHHYEILDRKSGERVKLNCSEARYRTMQVGDEASVTFAVGGFGIPYKWRFKKAEPGATDNPDDAQRLREDH